MPERSTNNRNTTPVWLRALLPMLLAAALVAPFLGRDIYDVDEAATMISACAHLLGPCSPAEAVKASARWPENGWGHAIAFSQWGQLVGWSEFAIRALPWLAGLLTVAWVYRLGRDLFKTAIALAAALLLSTSVLFLTYMHIARFYGPGMLFTTITLWGYWRVALSEKPPTRMAQVALFLGATGVLYSWYFGALLVLALGLHHLFLVRKDRRWWQSMTLLFIAALLALPQAPDLISGITYNQDRESLHSRALHAPEVISLFLRYLSSDLLKVPPLLASLLIPVLPFCLLLSWWRGRQRRPQPGAVRFLAVTSVMVLLFTMGANEWARVLDPTRVRYLSTLWPAALLLASLALLHPTRTLVRPPLGVLLLLAIALSGASDFLQEGPLVRTGWGWRKLEVTAATMRRALESATSDTLMVVDEKLIAPNRQMEAYVIVFDGHSIPLFPDTSSQRLLRGADANHEVVLLLRSSMEADLHLQSHVDFFLQRLWIHHQSWREDEITFVRFVSPFSTLLIDQNQLEYDQEITLVGSGILRETDKLRFLAHFRSRDENLLANYSLAVHVIDPSTGQRVAQSDQGVGPGSHVRSVSDIDIRALPPGDYELQVALYDWQTGERLNARDLQSGAVSDMHVLQQIRIG
ncbi:MAG: glycosyltransferase family 39 protein [Anaerolineaceae bacterium]|nr:glycosyltransferase family 39 protein [Anaerolineaceae bacterium]